MLNILDMGEMCSDRLHTYQREIGRKLGLIQFTKMMAIIGMFCRNITTDKIF